MEVICKTATSHGISGLVALAEFLVRDEGEEKEEEEQEEEKEETDASSYQGQAHLFCISNRLKSEAMPALPASNTHSLICP